MPTWIRWPLAALLIGGAATHAAYSIRYAWANVLAGEDEAPALERATVLAPANAAYWARLATLDPENRVRWLDRSLALNPSDALIWIERAVNDELAGNQAAAEAHLLEAARRDHQYVSRWALAAFYFRQKDPVHFQQWARQALEMAWGDALPMFQMAGQLGMSLDDVRRTMLPDRAPVLGAFLWECIRLQDFDETARVARRLVQIGDADNYRASVLSASGVLFAASRIDAAVALWNQAAAAHWMPNPPLDPPAGRLIANPEFSLEFLPGGFDWRQPVVDGVVYWRLGKGRGLEIELSGRQPEACTLLTLPMPVVPGKTYTLRVEASTSGLEPATGLHWRLGTHDWEAATNLNEIFEAPAEAKPLTLALVYTRALGTKRIEGTLTLRRVMIERAGLSARAEGAHPERTAR